MYANMWITVEINSIKKEHRNNDVSNCMCLCLHNSSAKSIDIASTLRIWGVRLFANILFISQTITGHNFLWWVDYIDSVGS